MLLGQLEKDQDAVEQVRTIVEQEENIMKKETQIVQDYADVSRIFILKDCSLVFYTLERLRNPSAK